MDELQKISEACGQITTILWVIIGALIFTIGVLAWFSLKVWKRKEYLSDHVLKSDKNNVKLFTELLALMDKSVTADATNTDRILDAIKYGNKNK